MIIRSRSPVRLGLGGGGTDVSPYTEEHGGAVLNVTINKYAWGTLSFHEGRDIRLHSYDFKKTIERSDLKSVESDGDLGLMKHVLLNMYRGTKGVKMYLRSDVPPRSGLGGSAAAFSSVIALFNELKAHNKLTPYELAELAHKLEREDMGVHGGRQDQYATVFGGLNFIEFKGNDFVRVTPVQLKKDTLLELEKNLVLVRLKGARPTEDVLTEQKKNVSEGKTIENMHKTKQLAYDMRAALLNNDLERFGELLHEAWLQKKQFGSKITNPEIDRLYEVAQKHGAIGGKITGAGGGGHMLFYCRSNHEEEVREALEAEGVEHVPFSFDHEGVQTWKVY